MWHFTWSRTLSDPGFVRIWSSKFSMETDIWHTRIHTRAHRHIATSDSVKFSRSLLVSNIGNLRETVSLIDSVLWPFQVKNCLLKCFTQLGICDSHLSFFHHKQFSSSWPKIVIANRSALVHLKVLDEQPIVEEIKWHGKKMTNKKLRQRKDSDCCTGC